MILPAYILEISDKDHTKSMALETKMEIPDLEAACQEDPTAVPEKVETKINHAANAHCLETGSCTSEVALLGCDELDRSKRSSQVVIIHIIKANLIDLENFLEGNNYTQAGRLQFMQLRCCCINKHGLLDC